ncbi:MAG: translation initiation factor IF-5A [Candidatus Nanoarchaeia archaeon]|nr:translation initiation factor IF-5A [Candidatus Nanoarchaeia archaeon]
MEKKTEDIGQMKVGRYILIEGVASKIVDIQRSAPGKHGHAKYRISAIGVTDNKKRILLKPGHSSVEVPVIEKKSAQILSISSKTKHTPDGTIEVKVANAMDQDSYETLELEIPEDMEGTVTEGTAVIYWEVMGLKLMKELKK